MKIGLNMTPSFEVGVYQEAHGDDVDADDGGDGDACSHNWWVQSGKSRNCPCSLGVGMIEKIATPSAGSDAWEAGDRVASNLWEKGASSTPAELRDELMHPLKPHLRCLHCFPAFCCYCQNAC